MAPRETWTDERLDDFRAETEREFTAVRTEMRAGFDRVEKRLDAIDKRFEKVDDRFEKISEEFVAVRREMKEGFDAQHRATLTALLSVLGCMFTGFAGLIAAQIWA